MGWQVYGEPLLTADFSGPVTSKCQKIILPDSPCLLAAIKAWIIVYNDPTFTDLCLKLYSNRNGNPDRLLYTSASVLKSDILTDLNAVKEVPFLFNDPDGIYLGANDTLWASVSGTGYTGDASSHLAWKKSYPDPVYLTNLTLQFENLHVAPLALVLVGELLK
jgi:hypothetical protein